MRVDTHVHVISPDLDRYPLNPNGMTEPWYRDDPCSVERLLGLMDAAAVDAAVLVQPFTAYQYDNSYCAYAAHGHPQRCTSVACVDVTAADAADVARQLVDRDGMRGLRWAAIREGSVGEPRALWDELAALRVPVVVTILDHRLPELAEAIPTLPRVSLALDHCGFASYVKGIPDELAALAAFPNLHLKVSSNALDLMAEHGDPADAVAELVARFGAERLMWGSDYSQTHDRSYGDLVEWGRVATTKLSDDQRESVLGLTALKLWPELAP